MGPQEGPQKLVLGVYFGLGRVLGPRWPQDPSRVLPRLIFLDFGTQLGGFWSPTCWILGPNLVDFKPLGLTFSKILDLKRCVRPQGCVAVCRRHLDNKSEVSNAYSPIKLCLRGSYLFVQRNCGPVAGPGSVSAPVAQGSPAVPRGSSARFLGSSARSLGFSARSLGFP